MSLSLCNQFIPGSLIYGCSLTYAIFVFKMLFLYNSDEGHQ